jgi:hypothetical protein
MMRPRPLNIEEIKNGVTYKILETIDDAITEHWIKTGLYARAYPKFKGKITIHLELNDPMVGTDVSNSTATFEDELPETPPIDIELEIPETPPNRFRDETSQPITVTAMENGHVVERPVKYQQRKKEGKIVKKSEN